MLEEKTFFHIFLSNGSSGHVESSVVKPAEKKGQRTKTFRLNFRLWKQFFLVKKLTQEAYLDM